MKHAAQFVELIHSATAEQAIEQRIQSYRAVVEQTASHAIAAHFCACADELERSLQNCNELQLEFQATHGGAR